MDLIELPRQLDAIDYAAERLGYDVSAVRERTEKIRDRLAVRPYAPDIRQYVINMRGWDMPPRFATSAFLDLQLERLIDMLATDEQRAEESALAARLIASLQESDWFDGQSQAGRGVTW
jgi:hypothetical protein